MLLQETSLHLACRNGCADSVNFLLKFDVDVTAQLSDGRNALMLAIDLQREACAIAIIQNAKWKDALRSACLIDGKA